MGGIKYYQLAKGEELPDEFCAVRDIGGEPSEYTFYVPEAENAKLRETLQRRTKQFEGMTEMWVERGVENAKLRELVRDMYEMAYPECPSAFEAAFADRMRELGVDG